MNKLKKINKNKKRKFIEKIFMEEMKMLMKKMI